MHRSSSTKRRITAVSYILVGYGRMMEIEDGVLFSRATVFDCYFTKFWPHSLILGTELTSYCLILVSCERLWVVYKPHIYRKLFGSHKVNHLVLGFDSTRKAFQFNERLVWHEIISVAV
ncbi:hypothetical protein OESDEN_08886 [Oesophagostomum dentatum]|uniref:G-protein coupled receptors family 1 profile domain-containing protein n=1 Tax=Oesophagostomum dentatum TaxID=61180 RepID=A0A0B1T141_OESDE|nr:hypothetical protein OESDEN_08886 [Oesophagostomum dentatum]